jgi:xylulokinase
MQILAHVLGIPVIRYSGSEKGPAFGAAWLARLAATGEAVESVCVRPPVLDVLQPDPSLADAYALRFEAYRKLYRGLRRQFQVGHARRTVRKLLRVDSGVLLV